MSNIAETSNSATSTIVIVGPIILIFVCDIFIVGLPSTIFDTKFGGSGGGEFNDLSIRNFTNSHYLWGMVTGSQMKPLEWCQFLCVSPSNATDVLQSESHGARQSTTNEYKFFLDENDKINKVPLIRGVRFFITNEKASQSIDHLRDELCTEEFDGYTVGYVDQMRFCWYRNTTS